MLYVRFLWQEEVRCVVGAGHLTRRVLCRATEDTNMHGFLFINTMTHEFKHVLANCFALATIRMASTSKARAYQLNQFNRVDKK